MKKTFIVLASLMVMICMICSCGGGSGSGSEKVAQLTLGVDINEAAAKSITVTDPTASYTFWYLATPQWTSEFGTVQGATGTTWTKFTNGTATTGYFAQGSWKFEVQVTAATSATATPAATDPVVYKSTATDKDTVRYINESSTTFTIDVERNIPTDTTATGTVNVNVKAPKAAASGDSMTVAYRKVSATTFASGDTISVTAGTLSDGFTPYTGTKGLTPGLYTFKIAYYSASDKLVSATMCTAEVIQGQTTKIEGSVEGGKWQNITFNVKGIYTLTATAAVDAQTGPTADSNSVYTFENSGTGYTGTTFTVTPVLKEGSTTLTTLPTGTSYAYKWSINGTDKTGDAAAFSLSATELAALAHSYAYLDYTVYLKSGTGTDEKQIIATSGSIKLTIK